MSRILGRVSVTVAFLSTLAYPLSATTVFPPTFDELVAGAREIFIGQVVARQSHWVDTREGRAIVTLVTFSIEESLKGGLQTQTSLEFLGGTVGDVTLHVAEMPEFRVGDHDLLFVGNRNAVSPIIGFMHGRFRIAFDPIRGVATVRQHNGRALVSTASLGRAEAPTLSAVPSVALADFRTAILARVRAQDGGAR